MNPNIFKIRYLARTLPKSWECTLRKHCHSCLDWRRDLPFAIIGLRRFLRKRYRTEPSPLLRPRKGISTIMSRFLPARAFLDVYPKRKLTGLFTATIEILLPGLITRIYKARTKVISAISAISKRGPRQARCP